jgi:hypothetical protein
VGDSIDGADHRLRRTIERHGRGYVLTVTSSQRLGLEPVADWREDLPAKGWRRLSAGDGAQGPRLYDRAWLPYAGAQEGWQKGLPIRRKLGQRDQFTFSLTLAPATVRLPELVRVAGTRWTIEACFPPRLRGRQGRRTPAAFRARTSMRCAPRDGLLTVAPAVMDRPPAAADGPAGIGPGSPSGLPLGVGHVTLAMLAHADRAALRRAAIGGSGYDRPHGGSPAAHRTRTPPAAVPSGLAPTARTRADHRLVDLAPPPAAPQARPLATPSLPT